MKDDWVTITHAQEVFDRASDEVDKMLRRETPNTPAGVEQGTEKRGESTPLQATMAHIKEHADRDAARLSTGTTEALSEGTEQAGGLEPMTRKQMRPLAELGQIITDRYDAIIEVLKSHEPNQAIKQNLTELTKAFEVTTRAIQGMNEMHRVTTAGFEATLSRQNQVMENLLTALQAAKRNTEAVVQYQQDFIEAVNRLPEPLQSIQDVQLGLIDLEEKRMALESGRVRFSETAAGRALSMIAYVLGVVLLLVVVSICGKIMWSLPDLLDMLKVLKGAG